MPNRAARIASAVFAAILTGATFTAILHVPADAAENCRTEPGKQTPDGQHWYYRIEHPGNRQCWYLRGEGESSAQAGATQRSENPVEPNAEAPAPQRSLADAHAELPSQQPRTEQNTNTGIPQPRQATPADAASAAAEQRPNVLESTTRGSLIGTRWPDPSSVNSTLGPQPAAPETVAEAQPDQATTPAPAAPPAALAAVDSSPAKPTGSLQTLLMVVAGALALAGLTASAVIRLGRRRRKPPTIDRARRRVVWEAADGAPQPSPPPRQPRPRQPPPRPSPSLQSPPETPPWIDPEYARRPGFSPSRHQSDDHNERLDRISEFLERMSKQPSN
jgi:hypothetical protein